MDSSDKHKFPPIELLDKHPEWEKIISEEEIETNKSRIKNGSDEEFEADRKLIGVL